MNPSLDDLLTAIEGLRGDRKAAFTVLMSAACTCMNIMLDEAEPELRAARDVRRRRVRHHALAGVPDRPDVR